MKKTCTQLIILVMVALIFLPVSATGQNTTNSTVVPTSTGTIVESPVTNQTPSETTATIPVTNTTTVPPKTITPVPGTTAEMVTGTTATTATTATTPAPATSSVTQVTVGNITVASSPLGASILVDGVFYGTTPGNFAGIPAGNHMVRLTLSGYYDYEGTIYVAPGQVTNIFGTLPPLSAYYTQPSTVPVTPVLTTPIVPAETVQPTPTQTSSGGALENPTIIAAFIGIITACIGAGATIFTHISKTKKE
jgi:hypothetical protein